MPKRTSASTQSPVVMSASEAVARAPITMNVARKRFLIGAWSATAPRMGDRSAMIASETELAMANLLVASDSDMPAAATLAKKIGKTAVMTMVMNGDLAQSYRAQDLSSGRCRASRSVRRGTEAA